MTATTSLPAELRARRQWVIWRLETRGGKPTKVPYQATRGETKASVTDPTTWSSYEQAAEAAQDADGCGYIFTAADEFAGIDLDACVDERGEMLPSAAAIVERLDSYTERSPSGRGVHIIVKAQLHGDRHRTSNTSWGGVFEAYHRGRFFTVTGHGSGTINQRQEQLDALMSEMLPAPPPRKRSTPSTNGHVDDDDAGLLRRVFAAQNGTKLEALFRGDVSAYSGDASAADLALCSMLAFWTDDPDHLDALFRHPGLCATSGTPGAARAPTAGRRSRRHYRDARSSIAHQRSRRIRTRITRTGTAMAQSRYRPSAWRSSAPRSWHVSWTRSRTIPRSGAMGAPPALQDAAERVGPFVAGGALNLQTTWQELEVAGHRLGLDADELELRIQTGLANGMTRPLELRDRAAPQAAGRVLGDEEIEPASDEDWPILPNLTAPRFPVSALGPEIAEYAEAVAANTQTAPDMPAVACVGILATAGMSAQVDVGAWDEGALGLYVLGVSPSGDHKSAVLNHVAKPLKELNREMRCQAKEGRRMR